MLTLCFSPVWCYPGSALDLTVGGFRGRGHWLTKPSHTRVLSQFDLRIFSWILNWGVMCQEWRETNTKHRKKSQLSSTQEEVAEKVPAMLKVKKQSGSSSKYSQVGWWWWKTSKAYSHTITITITITIIHHISFIHVYFGCRSTVSRPGLCLASSGLGINLFWNFHASRSILHTFYFLSSYFGFIIFSNELEIWICLKPREGLKAGKPE